MNKEENGRHDYIYTTLINFLVFDKSLLLQKYGDENYAILIKDMRTIQSNIKKLAKAVQKKK